MEDIKKVSGLPMILEQALKAYSDDLDKQVAQIAAETRELNRQEEGLRHQLRDWLLEILPEPLVERVDLSNVDFRSLNRTRSREPERGCWLTISLPDAFPVSFNVYMTKNDGFTLVREPFRDDDNLLFSVPSSARVGFDEDGNPQIVYNDVYCRSHAGWETAVGQALALWREHGERLMAELSRERFMGPEEAKPTSTDTEKLIRESWQMTQMMAFREGPRNGDDQLGMAQAYATLAIANELKRMNDRIEADADFASTVKLYSNG